MNVITPEFPSVSVEQLPAKLRREVQRYLKQNRNGGTPLPQPRFSLRGITWIAFDENGGRAFGATPVTAVRRLLRA